MSVSRSRHDVKTVCVRTVRTTLALETLRLLCEAASDLDGESTVVIDHGPAGITVTATQRTPITG